jgi:diguanylate cyclase (GGDEF)-like protein
VSILVVINAEETRERVLSLLEGGGHHDLKCVGCSQEALRLLGAANPEHATPFNSVLADVDLPGVGGVELCRWIRELSHVCNLPVLLLAEKPGKETLREIFDAGATDFVAKPVCEYELLGRVRSALKLQCTLKECESRENELLEATRQLQRLNEKLHRLAILDDLTGIANRRFFNVLLHQEWGRATREVVPLSLILIDIDYFKNYNDHYGHLQGDQCLKQVASTLNGMIRRPGDLVARFGGEEFVVLLAHTSLQGARAVAEGLRQGVENLNLRHPDSAVSDRVTISLGVASLVPDRGFSVDSLLAAADRAVYQAKVEGRNRVNVFLGRMEDPGLPSIPLPGPHRLSNLKVEAKPSE